MTREEIEKLSVVEPYRFESHFEKIWYEVGCIDGLKAADAEPNLERLWHDANEEPQYKNKRILGHSEYFDYFFVDLPSYLMILYGGQTNDWETVVLRKKISKWAYVKDLLPKGGEK